MKMFNKIIISFLMVLLVVTSATAESVYFTGDGGSALSISVEKPKVQNVGDDVAWLPDYANNVISDSIKKYSAITVVEKRYENAVSASLMNEEGGSYAESNVEAGNFEAAKSQLQVTIVAKSTSYNVSASVVDKKTLTSQASFNEDCDFSSLENGEVLKKAVQNILASLGVELTQKAKDELKTDASTKVASSSLEAQKLNAQAQQAQMQGNNIQALSLAMEASRKDATLQRVNITKSAISKQVKTGDFGEKARNAIQRRKEFAKLIDETKQYYETNLPFAFVYEPKLKEGKIDYEKETMKVGFKFYLVPTQNIKGGMIKSKTDKR